MHDPTALNLQQLLIWCNRAMPRVVEDQRRKFDHDDFFVSHSRTNQVKYSNLPHAPDTERREKFLQDCHEGRIPITFPQSGFNLELHVRPEVPGSNEPTSDSDYVRLVDDSAEVQICSSLILNGVCVRWRGWINRETLVGQGILEFDQIRAQHEQSQLEVEMQSLGERFRLLQQRLAPSSTVTSPNHMASSSITVPSPIVTTTDSSLT